MTSETVQFTRESVDQEGPIAYPHIVIVTGLQIFLGFVAMSYDRPLWIISGP